MDFHYRAPKLQYIVLKSYIQEEYMQNNDFQNSMSVLLQLLEI